MRYTELQKYLEKLKVFSTKDLKMIDDKFNKSKFSNREKKGYIKKIKRDFYLYGNLEPDQNLLFFVATKIYFPSYISLESALNYYGIIPEHPFTITCVSTRKTTDFHTQIGYFSYKKIKPQLFWGYNVIEFGDNKVFIGEPEKIVLDYFYLNPHIKDIKDLEGLRWNQDILQEKLDTNKLKKYGKIYNLKTINHKINLLLEYTKTG